MEVFLGVLPIASHILASLYLCKLKYNKLITAACWIAFAVFCIVMSAFYVDYKIMFFVRLCLCVTIFVFTTDTIFPEKIFLFLTYATSYCVYLGINNYLEAAFLESDPHIFILLISADFVSLHVFLCKILLPVYRRARMFMFGGWWKLCLVLVLFFVQFIMRYAFCVNYTFDNIGDFSVFVLTLYATLLVILLSIKETAEKNKQLIVNAELKQIAYEDALTKLQNRSAYDKYVKSVTRKQRYNEEYNAVCLVVLDVDRFKDINDGKGHLEGDRILFETGACLKRVFSEKNYRIFRIGGDEFAVIADTVGEEDIIGKIEELDELMLKELSVSISCGYSFLDFTRSKAFELAFKEADKKMYKTKRMKV